MTRVDVIVAGGGVWGASVAASLARAGRSVVLVDRNGSANAQGSSHGDGRIYRYAYGEQQYVDLMRRAVRGWERLEADFGRELLVRCGQMDMAAETTTDTLDAVAQTYRRNGLMHHDESGDGAARRCGVDRFDVHCPSSGRMLMQPDGGCLRADECVRVLWQAAQRAGATTIANGSVERWEKRCGGADGDSVGVDVHVRLGGGGRGDSGVVVTMQARRLVVAAGAWSDRLLEASGVPAKMRPPVMVTHELPRYYLPRDRAMPCGPDVLPPFVWHAGGGHYLYGLPELTPGIGVKVGVHCGDVQISDPNTRRNEPAGGTAHSDAERAGMDRMRKAVDEFVAERFPQLEPTAASEVSCLYTNTADAHFVIGFLPGSEEQVVLCYGGSGHGFKFGPAIGDLVVQLLTVDTATPLPRTVADGLGPLCAAPVESDSGSGGKNAGIATLTVADAPLDTSLWDPARFERGPVLKRTSA